MSACWKAADATVASSSRPGVPDTLVVVIGASFSRLRYPSSSERNLKRKSSSRRFSPTSAFCTSCVSP